MARATNVTLCEGCGHAARHHTGVTEKGYHAPKLACTFETDRYEVCTCDKLKVAHDQALELIVGAQSVSF